MGKANSKKHIEERREQVLLLLSKGYSQMNICRELNITRQTINELSDKSGQVSLG